ncbi:hypothetical protein [Cupriavidus sp. BIC8F]|nr:hypothetical protein [Cupriavidus sp. BIC8F]
MTAAAKRDAGGGKKRQGSCCPACLRCAPGEFIQYRERRLIKV